MAGIAMGIGATVNFINGLYSYKNSMEQAAAAGLNAQIADNNAAATRYKGVQEQDRILSNGKQEISKQLVAALEGGAMGGGTSENAIARSVSNLKKDLTNTAYNYETEAIGFLNEGKLQRYYGKVYKQNAAAGLANGVLGAAATVLNGAGTSATSGGVVSGGSAETKKISLFKPFYGASKLNLFGV